MILLLNIHFSLFFIKVSLRKIIFYIVYKIEVNIETLQQIKCSLNGMQLSELISTDKAIVENFEPYSSFFQS